MAVDTSPRRRRRTGGDSVRLPRTPVRELGPYHRATIPAGKVLMITVVALLLGGLLNVTSLTEAAERQAPGFKRDVSVVLVWPFQQISDLLGLDQPRELLTERLGRELDAGTTGGGAGVEPAPGTDTAGDVELDADGTALPASSGDALAAAAAVAGREPDGPEVRGATAIADVDPDAPAVATAAAELPERLQATFTVDSPLQVAIIGDSLTEQLGPSIIDRTNRPGVAVDAIHDFRYSSGLTRPDFFDWPAQAAQVAQEHDPDLWIVMMGANDAQDVRDDADRFRQLGSDEWEAIYSARVGALMDQLIRDGRGVIWVGQPIMRDAEFDESMAYISSLYEREAARRPLVSYVDARAVFAGEDGGYTDYLTGAGGQLSLMRLPDGIHLTRAGAQRLAEQIFPLLPVVTNPDIPAAPADPAQPTEG